MTHSKTYRKKPIEVEAFCWTPGCELPEWAWEKNAVVAYQGLADIHTPSGTMTIRPGDYLILGVGGEVHPCDPAIFERTHDLVSAEE